MIQEERLKEFNHLFSKINDHCTELNKAELAQVYSYILLMTYTSFVLFGVFYFSFLNLTHHWFFNYSFIFLSSNVANSFYFVLLKDKSFLKKHKDSYFSVFSCYPILLGFSFLFSLFLSGILSPIIIGLKSYEVDPIYFNNFVIAIYFLSFLIVMIFGIYYRSKLLKNVPFDDFVKTHKNNIESIKKEIFKSVKNIDDYNLFCHFVQSNKLVNLKILIPHIEDNLVSFSTFDNFNDLKTEALLKNINKHKLKIHNE